MSGGHDHGHSHGGGTAASAQKGHLTAVLAVTLATTAPEVLDRLGECLTGHFDLESSTLQLERQGHADHKAVLHS